MSASKQLNFWRGEGGDAYTAGQETSASRNDVADVLYSVSNLAPPFVRVLEVGCGNGGNHAGMGLGLWGARLTGVEPNQAARETAVRTTGLEVYDGALGGPLPFQDGRFDLVFTRGVLIHIAPENLGAAMDDLVRVSSRYVLVMEYFVPSCEPIRWRGQDGLLWRNDFGKLLLDRGLALVKCGFCWKHEGYKDSVTWWLMEKR